jgi:hypothetical protein
MKIKRILPSIRLQSLFKSREPYQTKRSLQAPQTSNSQTTPVPKTDSCPRRWIHPAPACRNFGSGPDSRHRHLPKYGQLRPARPRSTPRNQSHVNHPDAPASLALGMHLLQRNLSRHVTHLLFAAMDTLRPIGGTLGARAAFLLGARPARRRIERRGRLERCDVRRRKRRETPRGNAKRGSGICRDRRRN